jgi:hypothetical protein
MLSVRLAGAAVLVTSAALAARSYRTDIATRAARVQAWGRILEELRDGIRSRGAPLSELLPPLLEKREVRQVLPNGGAENGTRLPCLTRLLDRMAEDVVSEPSGVEQLQVLSDMFIHADDAQQLLDQLEEVIATMQRRYHALQQLLQTKCRAVTALCICGALALVLTLW